MANRTEKSLFMRARFLPLAGVAAVMVALAGCSQSGSGSGSGVSADAETAQVVGGVQTLDLVGSPANLFDKTTLYAKPGTLRLRLQVVGGTPHDLHVDGVTGAETALISGGEHAEATFTATPGTYRFICTIHPATMRGTLVVRAAEPSASASAG